MYTGLNHQQAGSQRCAYFANRLAGITSFSGNARIPKGSAPDSYNRLANLLGQDKTDRPWVIEQASNHTLSVRTKDWKFIEGSDGPKMIPWGPKIETGYLGIPQLYDMKQAGEKVNLATEHPEKVFELQQILRKVRDKSIQMK